MPSRQHAGPAPKSSEAPEPSLAERARTLASIARIGSLSTHSSRLSGYPFGSMMPFAIDDVGRPVFFISSMGMHTQNLQGDPRASLLITQPNVEEDPLGAARLTLVGTAKVAPAAEVSELYLSRFENARLWQDFTDFAYYRLEIEGIYFIGGFGVMGWIEPAEYGAASPDPLSAIAPGVIEHMNSDHADALRRIAARYADEAPEEASMTEVDRLGFHVRLKTGDRIHGLRIAFPREVKSANEAREVFIEMSRGS
jgi:putative heme iron utilization protein